MHINILELKAEFYYLKYFAKNYCNCCITLRIDNITAVACINRIGSVQHRSLNTVSREISQWCEVREILIFASYIKSKNNVIADRQSRALPTETEYELASLAFQKIVEYFGYPEIDLFAAYKNKKCEKYISWFPGPGSVTTDAFTILWSNIYFYAFLHFVY